MKHLICFTVFMLLLTGAHHGNARTGDQRFTLDNTRYHQIESRHTRILHELIVSLPDSYATEPDRKYPVFYYLDAYWDTGLINGIYNNLRFDNVIPEMILVGLSYPGKNVSYDMERLRDLSPSNIGDGTGGAEKFLEFLEKEAIPFVEKNYRTAPERALGGVSMGGLFSLYALYTKPELFKRHIAISPAVEWDNEHLVKIDTRFSKSGRTMPARLFLSYGTDEYQLFRDPIIRFQKQLTKRKYKDLTLQNYAMEGLRHTGVKADGYVRGLMWVWKDLAPAGPSGLEKIYRAREEAATPRQ